MQNGAALGTGAGAYLGAWLRFARSLTGWPNIGNFRAGGRLSGADQQRRIASHSRRVLALEANVAKATEEFIADSVRAYEARLRREIATVAMEVSRFYEVVRNGDTLTIRVLVEDKPKRPA